MRRKLEERNIRKINRTKSGTVLVSLPIEIFRELKWRDKQKIVVKKVGSRVIIEDWKK